MNKCKVWLLRLIIRTIGRLSCGIDMSFKYGFISGMMLDYIYENRAHGSFFIGKFIDRIFLNNIGWKGIRQRKENLKGYIKALIEENRKQGEKTVILDIASGPAKYLIEVLAEIGEHDVCAICQDIDNRWLEHGKAQAAAAGLSDIHFEKGDAFNFDLLSKVSPKPNVIVSSGFYDWITDDELIKKSFVYSYKLLPAGGKIIFTNQAGHKQMELVSSVFVDFNQQPLRMKTRSPESMVSFAKASGFTDCVTIVDKWGLYSVTKGEKC